MKSTHHPGKHELDGPQLEGTKPPDFIVIILCSTVTQGLFVDILGLFIILDIVMKFEVVEIFKLQVYGLCHRASVEIGCAECLVAQQADELLGSPENRARWAWRWS